MWNEQTNGALKDYINLDTGLNRVRGNQSLYRRMLQMFCVSEEFDALENALTEKDLVKAGEVAHAIKGMTGNLSLDRLFTVSDSLTNQLRRGVADPATIDEYRRVLAQTRIHAEKVMENLTV